MTHEPALERKSTDIARRQRPPLTPIRRLSDPEVSGASSLRRRVGNGGVQALMGEVSGRFKGPRPLRSVDQAQGSGSPPIMQRKCVACESTGGKCPECDKDEKSGATVRMTRIVSTTQGEERELTTAKDRSGKTREKWGEEGPIAKDDKKEAPVKCPKETITMSGAKCGTQYGAVARYCYDGAAGWWFKESVKNGPGPLCQPGNINQTTTPFQSQNPCIADRIFDNNGPPKDVAPCDDTTFQTVFIGPTKDKVEQCQYQHTQVINVTVTKGSNPKSGKVITNAGGTPAECAWTS